MVEVVKAALVRLDRPSEPVEALVFSHNPEKLRRHLVSRPGEPPEETISCTAVFDVFDEVAAEPPVDENGVLPPLAALELLLHEADADPPTIWERLFGVARKGSGPPAVLFVWGEHRAIPVRITQLDMSEELHDPRLRPLRATVRLTMRVITDEDVPPEHPAFLRWRAHVAVTRALADRAYTDQVPGFGM